MAFYEETCHSAPNTSLRYKADGVELHVVEFQSVYLHLLMEQRQQAHIYHHALHIGHSIFYLRQRIVLLQYLHAFYREV